jgi:hypothetical protein
VSPTAVGAKLSACGSTDSSLSMPVRRVPHAVSRSSAGTRRIGRAAVSKAHASSGHEQWREVAFEAISEF